MNLESAKKKLADISKSTGTKHPKVLVSELASVLGFVLGELEKLPSPTSLTMCQGCAGPDTIIHPAKRPLDHVEPPNLPIEEINPQRWVRDSKDVPKPRVGPDVFGSDKGDE